MKPERIMVECPNCTAQQEDLDGFGVLHCTVCGYCAHPSRDGQANGTSKCGLCGKVFKGPACEHPTVAQVLVEPFPVLYKPGVEATKTTPEIPGEVRMSEKITVVRSCGHTYFAAVKPEIGAPAMACLGPQLETAASGRVGGQQIHTGGAKFKRMTTPKPKGGKRTRPTAPK